MWRHMTRVKDGKLGKSRNYTEETEVVFLLGVYDDCQGNIKDMNC